MKKFFRVITAITMWALLLVPMNAFAAESNEAAPVLVSSEQVTLVPSDATARNSDSRVSAKEFTLNTFDDNGVTVYSFDVEDQAYRKAAMEYINQLTGDPGPTRGPLLPGQSEYHSDIQYDGSAVSYAWKRNTASTWDNNFEGGQSALWSGSGNASYIVLNQGISVSGIMVSISWPPSISGNGSSGSWQSQPIYGNSAGSTFSGLVVGGTAFSCTFTENGDVYVGNRVYRPATYIKFSYFS